MGSGWLGWEPGIAEKTDCCLILLAYQGDLAKLRAIYGEAEEKALAEKPPSAARPLTPDLFKSLFG